MNAKFLGLRDAVVRARKAQLKDASRRHDKWHAPRLEKDLTVDLNIVNHANDLGAHRGSS